VTLVAVLVAVVWGLPVGVAGAGQDIVRGNLRLDGMALRPELALTAAARAKGLMRRKRAPADGMLFVFPAGTNGGFWMKNTLVPLSIVFFDSTGKRVRRLEMKPCKADPCPIYVPRRRYRFALELPGGDERQALRLGPRAELGRLIARAS
jgi:uncharacterized membrane protein (UPF0127 family)